MNAFRWIAVALSLMAGLAAHADAGGSRAASAADVSASSAMAAVPGMHPAPPWREDLPADRAIALLLLAGIGLLGLRASRNRE
jgi:hypothetical protein